MNTFLLNYNGNKYLECKKYLKNFFTKSQYKHIIEPFSGIFGLSRSYYEFNTKKGVKYHLNDIDTELIKTLKHIKSNFNQVIDICEKFYEKNRNYSGEELKKIINNHEYNYLLRYIFRGYRAGLYHMEKGRTKVQNFKLKEKKYKAFFKQCTFYNLSYDEFLDLDEIKKLKNKLIFYDPPYFNSCNLNYQKFSKIDKNKCYNDNTSFYIEIYENINTNIKDDQIIILNKIDLINYIYSDLKTNIAFKDSKYGSGSIKRHILYSNIDSDILDLDININK